MTESKDITAEHARAAAQMEADVGVEHIANVYAKALLDATEQAGQTAAVFEEFDAVVAEMVGRFPKLEAILDSILVLPEEKAALIDRIMGGRVSPLMVNFLKVVARHGRLDCLRAIHCQTHAMYDKLRGRVPVRLTTAAPVDPAMAGRIVENLRAQDRRRADPRTTNRPQSDWRRRPSRRRRDLRRLDRQSIAKSSPTDSRQECP